MNLNRDRLCLPKIWILIFSWISRANYRSETTSEAGAEKRKRFAAGENETGSEQKKGPWGGTISSSSWLRLKHHLRTDVAYGASGSEGAVGWCILTRDYATEVREDLRLTAPPPLPGYDRLSSTAETVHGLPPLLFGDLSLFFVSFGYSPSN